MKDQQVPAEWKPAENEYLCKDLFAVWIAVNEHKWKPSTKRKNLFLLEKHILPHLGNWPISKLSNTTIRSFLKDVAYAGNLRTKERLSASYVRTIAVVLQAGIQCGISEGFPFLTSIQIPKPCAEKTEIFVLSSRLQKKLEKYLLDNMNETKLGILLSLRIGVRIGEICALQWNDIDFDNRTITIRHTISRVSLHDGSAKSMLILDEPKSKASIRTIPLTNELVFLLNNMQKVTSSPFVVSEKRCFLSPRTFDARYRRILKSAGFPVVNFHTLRHTFATRCVEAGVEIKALSEILGHANVSFTLNTYIHPSLEQKRQQLEKVVF